jgi:hypothetical protein
MKRSWPNFKVISQHSTEETEKNHKNRRQDSWSQGRDLITGSPAYEAEVSNTVPRRSVCNIIQ